ncbi:hypothetical protein IGJ19_002349 [Enterococcus sp. DIV1368b]|uniref:ATPase AAA-type core domain-containing protein n=1 Tax=Enterococcus mundtii TaxID=53346 RepID=A0A242L2C0_ENTMU|nr:ATP-binding protein [Enterococcus mundtii]OTP28347.1 hypothetical protein A5802_002088 [Enterococcus mundtii]
MDKIRGSQFRKWDLHVHSLHTFINNRFGYNKENKLDYFQKYFEVLKENNIEVIGLTNYFNFTEDDFELKKFLNSKGIVVFMNLEVRLANLNRKHEVFDYHVIFDDNLENQIIKNLLAELKASIGSKDKAFNLLTQSEIEKNAVISFDQLKDKLQRNPDLKGKYLTGFLSRGHGSATSGSDSRGQSVYEDICKNSDFIIHSSCNDPSKCTDPNCRHGNLNKDRNYWLNNAKYVKPLLQSSDAHSFEDIGSKYSWIKSDKSFEGLKQILFEPEDRICLDIAKPQLEKFELVIDKIVFKNKELYLSENLNSIIGGRANGKSTLLNSIAKKLGENVSDKNYTFEDIENFKIIWKDGEENNDRKIEYIPQEYMFNLANENEGLNKLVKKIISSKKLDNKIEEYETECKSVNLRIQSLLTKYFTDIELLKELQKPEEEKGITEKRIKQYETDRDEILSKNNFTQEEKELFSQQSSEKENLELEIRICNAQKTLIENLTIQKSIILGDIVKLDDAIKEDLSKFTMEINKELIDKFNYKISQIMNSLEKSIKISECKVKQIEEGEIFLKGLKISQSNVELKYLNDLIDNENKVLEAIKEYEKSKKILDSEINNSKDNIIKEYKKYRIARDQLEKEFNICENDLKMALEFKQKNFYEEFTYINGQGSAKDIFVDNLQSNFENEVDKIFDNNTLKFNNNKTKNDLIRNFYSNNFYKYDFKIIYQEDEFKQMSPGKKAFVILKLILEFSESKVPVLIDQPEDSLDNRAIYNELTKYIKETKKKRQIIIVTHNPNVVVGSDCENIIVANQHSNNSKNKDARKFDYINGGLENNFTKDSDYVLEKQGIREHIFEILEGGMEAFEKREKKYNVKF